MNKSRITPLGKTMIIVSIVVALFVIWKYTGLDKIIGNKSENKDTLMAAYSEGASRSDYNIIISGSNTLGAQLCPELFKAFFEKRGVTDFAMQNINSTQTAATMTFNKSKFSILIQSKGTSIGFADVLIGGADAVMASRPIKDLEKQNLIKAGKGDFSASNSEYAVVLDGLAIVVNKNNPLRILDKSIIAKIFLGQINNWSEIGGNSEPILLYGHDALSGTADAFQSIVLNGQKVSSTMTVRAEGKEIADLVASNSGAIGFTSFSNHGDTKTLAISDGTSNALLPNKLTIATEDYPLTRKLYIYLPTNTSAVLQDFVKFCVSSDGQALASRFGFVEFTSQKMTDKAYKELPSQAIRLSINFRFKTGALQLDNKALIDIGRLVEKNELSKADVYLVGFADSQGDDAENQALSLKRAEAVKAELSMAGLMVKKMYGLGETYPVADNNTDEGRQKNRRVEIWIVNN